MTSLPFFLLACLFFLLLCKFTADLFRYWWKIESKFRETAKKISLVFLSLFFSCLVLELGLNFFYVQSDYWGFTGSALRWWEIYWHPVNSFGYRDQEFTPQDLTDKKVLMVVGDSFVAGHGINDISDRFSNQLAAKLPQDWRVLNIARCGWNSDQELEALTKHLKEIHPRAIILSYFFNDLEEALKQLGYPKPVSPSLPTGTLAEFVNHSSLVNFLYWTSFRFKQQELNQAYWESFKSAAHDARVWQKHFETLNGFIKIANENNAKLFVVIFPYFPELNLSHLFTDQVMQFFKEHNVAVLDLDQELGLKARPLNSLVVNKFDCHANADLNHEIADLIYRRWGKEF